VPIEIPSHRYLIKFGTPAYCINSNFSYLLFIIIFFKSYISESSFAIKAGKYMSFIPPILSDIPQDAVSSPILFYLYSADQHTHPKTHIAEYDDNKAI
jgi:hypothetical protein